MIFGLNPLLGIVGYVFFALLCLASLYNIYSPAVNDGFVGRLLYVFTALSALAGIIELYEKQSTSTELVYTLLWLFVFRAVRNAIVHFIGDRHAVQ